MSRPAFVIDTHALFWYELADPQLSAAAAFREAEQGQADLIIHPVVLAEMYYIMRKLALDDEFASYIDFVAGNPLYRVEPVTLADIRLIPKFTEIPEMHDRLIAIQAHRLGASVVTRDRDLRASPQVRSVW
jgi:predicted nucleic acid-binding protein